MGTTLILILPLLAIANAAVDRNTLKVFRPCFERYPNHQLAGVKPYHSEFRMASEEECLHFCALTATRCRSIVYDFQQHLCHFFLDDGAQQAEFAPRMIYFRVTAKQCLDDQMRKLPASSRYLPTRPNPIVPPKYKSPVVARRRGGLYEEKKRKIPLDAVAGVKTHTLEQLAEKPTTTSTAAPTQDIGINKQAMNELVQDIEKNAEMFEREEGMEQRAGTEEERDRLNKMKEEIRVKLKEKIAELKAVFPDMYTELMGEGEKTEGEGAVFTLDSTTHRTKLNDGEIDRPKKARAPSRLLRNKLLTRNLINDSAEQFFQEETDVVKDVITAETTTPVTANQEEAEPEKVEKEEGNDYEGATKDDGKAKKKGEEEEKKFLAIPDADSGEFNEVPGPVVDNGSDEKSPSASSQIRSSPKEIRKSPRPLAKNAHKSELEKPAHTLSKARMFAAQLNEGNTEDGKKQDVTKELAESREIEDGEEEQADSKDERSFVSPPSSLNSAFNEMMPTTLNDAFKERVYPDPVKTTPPTMRSTYSRRAESRDFLQNDRKPVVEATTAVMYTPESHNGCEEEEIPLWVRFENAEPAEEIDGDFSLVRNKNECEQKCNQAENVHSITYSEKDRMCQCNTYFDGVSLKRSTADDFSVSTSTRFCFKDSLTVFHDCGTFMGFRDFTLNVAAREQFEGFPKEYEGLQLCIELCALSSEYHCKSASFDFHAGRCTLNDADSASHPNSFAPTLVDNLLYFENSCDRRDGDQPREESNVRRVSGDEGRTALQQQSRGGIIGGLKVKPILRSTYSLRSPSIFNMARL